CVLALVLVFVLAHDFACGFCSFSRPLRVMSAYSAASLSTRLLYSGCLATSELTCGASFFTSSRNLRSSALNRSPRSTFFFRSSARGIRSSLRRCRRTAIVPISFLRVSSFELRMGNSRGDRCAGAGLRAESGHRRIDRGKHPPGAEPFARRALDHRQHVGLHGAEPQFDTVGPQAFLGDDEHLERRVFEI